jgi:cytochrome d ubiquinol oxidase subunit II
VRAVVVLAADQPDLWAARQLFGATFALSSVVTPFFLGAVAGAVASGRVPAALPATVAVVAVMWGWAAAQYPSLLVDELTITAGAGSRATLVAMLASLAVGAVLFVPPLVALLRLHLRGQLGGQEARD